MEVSSFYRARLLLTLGHTKNSFHVKQTFFSPYEDYVQSRSVKI